MTITRRDFLGAGATLVAGLTIAVPLDVLTQKLRVWKDDDSAVTDLQPFAFLRIGADDIVTVWAVRLEMGQGIRTTLAMMVAEELEVEWSSIRVEQAPTDGRFREIQIHTAGSGNAVEAYEQMRTAGAAAREMLIAAAAQGWNVPVSSLTVERGVVIHAATNRRRTFGSLAAAASALPVPRTPKLKDRAQFRVLGKPKSRVDGDTIVTGRAQYGTDVVIPGMQFASILRAPTLGAQVASVDATEALRVPGVTNVVRVTAGVHAGVAVIARDTWSAMRGRERLRVSWQSGPFATFDSEAFIREQRAKLDAPYGTRRFGADVDTAFSSAAKTIDATYVFPFQAHAPVETMHCTAHVRSDSVELWLSTQSDVRTLQEAARVSGIPKDRITVHYALCGGAFGRRLFGDFVAEAVELSKSIDAPVQVLWTRTDDMRYGYFQPATTNRYSASIDTGGNIRGMHHRSSSADLTIYDIHAGRPLWSGAARPAKTNANFEMPGLMYAFPAYRMDVADVTSPVPTGPWRAVDEPAQVFARESFVDEVAHATGKDPITFRRELLRAAPSTTGARAPLVNRTRLLRVLDELANRSAAMWPIVRSVEERDRVGRGVAINSYQGLSFIAMMAEVAVSRDRSSMRVTHMMTIVDCGLALNPLGIEGQTESAIAWGLSAALHGKINFRNGAAVESSYRDFRVLRMNEMPTLDTIILESDAPPTGYGEHPVPLIAPAVANAVFAACGVRARELPIKLV